MAKQELRVPIASLMEEKAKLEKSVITLRDKVTSKSEELGKLRKTQFEHREAKQSLSNKDTNKAAKLVLDKLVTDVQIKIDQVQRELEIVSLEYEKENGQLKNLMSAIKELEGA